MCVLYIIWYNITCNNIGDVNVLEISWDTWGVPVLCDWWPGTVSDSNNRCGYFIVPPRPNTGSNSAQQLVGQEETETVPQPKAKDKNGRGAWLVALDMSWYCILRQYVNQKIAPHDLMASWPHGLILLQLSHFGWCPACALQNWGNLSQFPAAAWHFDDSSCFTHEAVAGHRWCWPGPRSRSRSPQKRGTEVSANHLKFVSSDVLVFVELICSIAPSRKFCFRIVVNQIRMLKATRRSLIYTYLQSTVNAIRCNKSVLRLYLKTSSLNDTLKRSMCLLFALGAGQLSALVQIAGQARLIFGKLQTQCLPVLEEVLPQGEWTRRHHWSLQKWIECRSFTIN